jgi:tripartite-type tricarboxylate transporter receptor subunit TctC
MVRASALLAGLIASIVVPAVDAGEAKDSNYPARPVRVIVPFAPGGPSDILGRLMSQKLTEVLGQNFVVDNRGSAGGVVGFEIAANAIPDGYTILIGGGSALTQNPHLYAKLPYSPSDFQPVTQITSGPNLLVVHPSVPAKSVQDLIALAKAKPGQVNFASAGTGNRLSSELFKSTAGIDIVNVPYKGTGQAINELVAGHVQMMMMNMIAAMPQVKAGKLRGLAVTTLKRSAVLPDVPTVAESGLPGFEVTSWHLAIVPVKTPKAIVGRLNNALVKIVHMPDVKERLQTQGLDPVGSTPEALTAYMKEESVKYAKLIKQIGLKGE